MSNRYRRNAAVFEGSQTYTIVYNALRVPLSVRCYGENARTRMGETEGGRKEGRNAQVEVHLFVGRSACCLLFVNFYFFLILVRKQESVLMRERGPYVHMYICMYS